MINQKFKENLANTAVKIGVNIQPNQFLVINSPIETADFAREIAKAAYKAGAEDVYINYSDEIFNQIRLTSASKDVLRQVPDWWKDRLDSFIERGAAIINIEAVNPDLLKDVDREKFIESIKARQDASENYKDALMENKNRWCVISVPTESWAKKVFPFATGGSSAEDLLWNAIIRATYSNLNDPIEEWRHHDKQFKERAEWLNKKQFDSLHFQNELGTDLYVGLPENHIWSGGSEKAQDGISFFPNLPTEEIYTAPNKYRVNGWIKSSYPLSYNGRIIEGIKLLFVDGRIIKAEAETNENLLNDIINIDENAQYLGEVALVPQDSPISDMNILFYNTLFDENASCHLAFGSAYPNMIKDGIFMNEKELDSKGLNKSKIHLDFMIGTDDMKVTGIHKDGSCENIFINGQFVELKK